MDLNLIAQVPNLAPDSSAAPRQSAPLPSDTAPAAAAPPDGGTGTRPGAAAPTETPHAVREASEVVPAGNDAPREAPPPERVDVTV